MASGVEFAAGLAGLISLTVACFNGCVEGIQVITTAKGMNEDGGRVRCMLDWECYRLVQWGSRVCLSEEKANSNLNWPMASDILERLKELLTDAKTLREYYNLVVDEERPAKTASPLVSSLDSSTSKIWRLAKPDIRNIRARILKASLSSMKKLKWAVLDYDKVKSLVQSIGRNLLFLRLSLTHTVLGFFVNCLYDLLEKQEKDEISLAISTILRNVVSRTLRGDELDAMRPMLGSDYIHEKPAIDAALDLKKQRLMMKVDQTEAEKVSPNNSAIGTKNVLPRVIKLSASNMTLHQSKEFGETAQQFATYKLAKKNYRSHVLLEWKRVHKDLVPKLRHRVFGLSVLLGCIDPSFNCLPCIGVLEINTVGSDTLYAYAFEVENIGAQLETEPEYPKVTTLSALLDNSPPSLTDKIEIALVLAKSVLQFHTSGWLHKGIRSQNIIFLGQADSKWTIKAAHGPYVAGFEFTRADNPLEFTEDTPSTNEIDLYKHEETFATPRHSFKKRYDLFALGCVLIEVALWKPLSEVFLSLQETGALSATADLNHTASANEKEHLRWKSIQEAKTWLYSEDAIGNILDHVAISAGNRYRAAVQLCFFPETDPDIDDEDAESSLYTQQLVVQNLTIHV